MRNAVVLLILLMLNQSSIAQEVSADSTSLARQAYTPSCLAHYKAYLGMSSADSFRLNGCVPRVDHNGNSAGYYCADSYLSNNRNYPPVTYFINGMPGVSATDGMSKFCPGKYNVTVYLEVWASGACGHGNCCYGVRMLTSNGSSVLNGVNYNDEINFCQGDWGQSIFQFNGTWDTNAGDMLPPILRDVTSQDYGVLIQGEGALGSYIQIDLAQPYQQ